MQSNPMKKLYLQKLRPFTRTTMVLGNMISSSTSNDFTYSYLLFAISIISLKNKYIKMPLALKGHIMVIGAERKKRSSRTLIMAPSFFWRTDQGSGVKGATPIRNFDFRFSPILPVPSLICLASETHFWIPLALSTTAKR